MKRYHTAIISIFILSITTVCKNHVHEISLNSECSKTLKVLVDALLDRQVHEINDPNFGALICDNCDVYHTRAAEAVYPFAVVYKQTNDEKYLSGAKWLGNWLIKQQRPEGEWHETPESWTGTTTDQLLMMLCAYPILENNFSATEKEVWQASMRRAADYLTLVMSDQFASINYCATTSATLALANQLFEDERYLLKAKDLALQVISKMNTEGFIEGEGGRIYGIKYGADIGYEIDMTLWGLGLYASITDDVMVSQLVEKSLQNHLYFIYPNGSIDGSWGIRSNKWTTYGSKTADGCQILFSLYTKKDARYRTAAIRNLRYLRKMIRNGMIGYGPHYCKIADGPPCIYPTFTRAKNLALAIEMGDQESGDIPELPSDRGGWLRYFPSVDVALVRSKHIMTTITAYRYKDVMHREVSKYMHRPTGGSISNLWVQNHGFLQTSSQTEYNRWEPMHFPEVGNILCLTPRIEFEDENGYFSNLYEYDGHISVEYDGRGEAVVSTSGYLKDKTLYPGGIAYTWKHTILDNAVEKFVEIRYHGKRRPIRIVEPIVRQDRMQFDLVDSQGVRIHGGQREFYFEVLEGSVSLELGRDESKYWSPFPAIQCYPIVLNINPVEGQYKQEIKYKISLESW